MAVELLIAHDDGDSVRQIMRFEIGTDNDFTVNMPKVKRIRLPCGSYALEVEIVLLEHYYLIKMNGTEMGQKLWPKEWWNKFQWHGVNSVKVQGQLTLVEKPSVKQIGQKSDSSNDRPIILAWNKFFRESIFEFDKLLFGNKNCSFQCVYTEDKKFQSCASVVIFHLALNLAPLPQHRNAEQLYVLVSHENPLLGRSVPTNFFNISITYRTDSTIFMPYDALSLINAQTMPQQIWSEAEIRERVARKKRLVVQFVSNCGANSGRDRLTAELQKLIEFDVFGSCNNKLCDDKCYQSEQESHFFYAAFENSVCTDYVTEKFWMALRNLIVPIVLSRKVMEKAGIPNGTFIAADDFDNVQALADHLKALQMDKDKYMGYFNWTKTYQKYRSGDGIQPPLCQLCEIAHQQRQKDKFKPYTVQLDTFWDKWQCKKNFVQEELISENMALGNHVCSICHHAIGYYNNNTLPCGHVFHPQCLAPWLPYNACPMCRTPIHYSGPWPNQPWPNSWPNVHNIVQHHLTNAHGVVQQHLASAQRLQSDAMANAQRVQTEAMAQAHAASRRISEEARASAQRVRTEARAQARAARRMSQEAQANARQQSHGAENRAQYRQSQNNWVVIDGVRHQIDGPEMNVQFEGNDLIVNGQRFANAARNYSIISEGNVNYSNIGK
ncbi:hypothetical protein niasHT_034057 [Heterodera trifolii]|uniref:Fucosyltransferase n=1 Tax=Heterodera trifolii TaxID=157864 RepID=A0ABD2I4F0_9BILA